MDIDVKEHIRPLDPLHDMPVVLDLIEIGFKDELDPQGWKMLRQMRRMYQPGFLTQLIYNPGMGTRGFVWVEDEHIIANLSLRHAQPRTSQGRLIGNVVVHPDYRNQGIGRALMERAITTARRERAQWVGLEVRVDNDIASGLYERLGFQSVGIVEHMLRPGGIGWPDGRSPQRSWRRSTSEDRSRWTYLATLIYNYDQRHVLEIRPSLYDFGGFEKRLGQVFNREREQAWVCEEPNGQIRLASHIETDRRHHFHIWDLLLHPDVEHEGTQELIAQSLSATQRYPDWPVVAIVPDQPILIDALQDVGFGIHRTLQQMILYL